MINLNNVDTEKRNVKTMNLHTFSPYEIVKIINEEDQNVAVSIEKHLSTISIIVEKAAKTIQNGGRIIYVGAGTSGRLGVLDAVECPPTFGVEENIVIGLIAGGDSAFVKAIEGAEDSLDLGQNDLKNINLTDKDYVIGLAASGRTPYVIGALKYANEVGAKTAALSITTNAEISKFANDFLEVPVGSEILTGSTRMKAGTAQKMILNMISTGAMILNGKVYQNLMVDVLQTNKKLEERAKRIVMEATDCDYNTAKETLNLANGSAKVAIVMLLNSVNETEALNILHNSRGFIV